MPNLHMVLAAEGHGVYLNLHQPSRAIQDHAKRYQGVVG